MISLVNKLFSTVTLLQDVQALARKLGAVNYDLE